MLFSVIVPAYNCEKSIEKTVKSILQSGLFDFEILLIDDGSSDRTPYICEQLVSKYNVIRCIHQDNAGVSMARNCGIKNAKGKYLLFFDADDSVDYYSLRNTAEKVKQAEPDMLIFGLSFDYYYNGRMYRRDELVYPKECLLDSKQWSREFQKLYQCNALSPVWNKFIKRELLIEHQVFFNKDLIEMEDFLFVICCMQYCKEIYFLPEVIYRYKQAENGKSTFNRLCKISNLVHYMTPFVESIDSLDARVKLLGSKLQNKNDVICQIYATLFWEKLRFSNINEIKKIVKEMLDSKYAEYIKKMSYKNYLLFEKEQYKKIWLLKRISIIRHWIAIRVKYFKSLYEKRI